MKAKISVRQLCFFLAAIAPVGKLILMPTQLTEYAKNDLLFSAVINFVLQAAVIFLVLLLSRNNKTFYELLEYTFGKIAAKVIIIIFSLFLFYAALLPMMEQKYFVHYAFYDTLPTVIAFSPFFVVSAYLCTKPLSHFGRIWDILAPVAIAGFIGLMVFSVGEADFSALAPVGAAGAKGVFSGTAYTMSWFYDSVILLFLMGKFEYEKGLCWKGMLCYLAGATCVMFFLAVFYGIFSDIAVRQIFAFAKISKYFAAISVLGRVDFVFIYSLALVMAFYYILPLHAGIDGITEAFGQRDNKLFPALLSIAVNAVFLILSLVLNFHFRIFSNTISKTLFWIFPLFALLLPVIALALRRSPREKAK